MKRQDRGYDGSFENIGCYSLVDRLRKVEEHNGNQHDRRFSVAADGSVRR